VNRRFVLSRLGQSVLVLWLTFTMSFVILYVVPGNPVEIMLAGGEGGVASAATPAQVAAVSDEFGFNHPLLVQYVDRLGSALKGNFGNSVETGESVTHTIFGAAVPTLQLALAGGCLAVLLGVGVALLATRARRPWVEQLILSIPSVGVSVPTFWVGLMLIDLLAFHWKLLPAIGDVGLETLVLPAITISLPSAALIAQVLAKSLRSTLGQPYTTMLRAKGASENRILIRHAFHNAAVPTLSLFGVVVGNLLAGSVVVETVFSRNGIGRIIVDAVTTKDIPVVQGVVVFTASAYVLATLAVDLIAPLIDKRVAVAPRSR
jgi:peptide/nickel transport system permease protein